MPDKLVYLTPEGRQKLEHELENLRVVRRVEVAEQIRASKEFSDTEDNSEFEAAKNEQAFVEGRILTIEKMLANAVEINADHQLHDSVRIGSDVTVLSDEGEVEKYTIVGSAGSITTFTHSHVGAADFGAVQVSNTDVTTKIVSVNGKATVTDTIFAGNVTAGGKAVSVGDQGITVPGTPIVEAR